MLIRNAPCFLTKLYASVQKSSNFLNISLFYPPITCAISIVSTNGDLSRLKPNLLLKLPKKWPKSM